MRLDEWLEVRPAILAKSWESLTAERAEEKPMTWIVNQFGD
jgi:hypothetical protein